MIACRACELGRKDIVKALLDTEADGRIHPVTRYSPLYIACFKGHREVVELLLKVSSLLTASSLFIQPSVFANFESLVDIK